MVHRAFTLIEMLLAVTLSTILMGGLLVATSALSRDRLRMEARQAASHSSGAIDFVRRDLANAVAFAGPVDASGFELVGFGGIDVKTLLPNQRLVRVRYRVVRQGQGGILVREQAYLDDPVRIDRWSDVVAVGVTKIAITPLSTDGENATLGEEVGERLLSIDRGPRVPMAARVPSRVRVRIEYLDGVIDRDMVLR